MLRAQWVQRVCRQQALAASKRASNTEGTLESADDGGRSMAIASDTAALSAALADPVNLSSQRLPFGETSSVVRSVAESTEDVACAAIAQALKRIVTDSVWVVCQPYVVCQVYTDTECLRSGEFFFAL